MILLGIDTSGKTASVALCTKECVLSQNTVFTKLTHSQVILPLCKNTLSNAGITLNDIDGIAVTNGPGSYTGLRIGISAVKAMCFSLGIKCIGISTLESLAFNMAGAKCIICSVMTARADLMYTALFESDGINVKRLTDDEILPISEILASVKKLDSEVILTGDGVLELCKNDILNGANKIAIAPPHLRFQLASSACYAAFSKDEQAFIKPDYLYAEYLQITKAEKDLIG